MTVGVIKGVFVVFPAKEGDRKHWTIAIAENDGSSSKADVDEDLRLALEATIICVRNRDKPANERALIAIADLHKKTTNTNERDAKRYDDGDANDTRRSRAQRNPPSWLCNGLTNE